MPLALSLYKEQIAGRLRFRNCGEFPLPCGPNAILLGEKMYHSNDIENKNKVNNITAQHNTTLQRTGIFHVRRRGCHACHQFSQRKEHPKDELSQFRQLLLILLFASTTFHVTLGEQCLAPAIENDYRMYSHDCDGSMQIRSDQIRLTVLSCSISDI